jgi:hypothetical protein
MMLDWAAWASGERNEEGAGTHARRWIDVSRDVSEADNARHVMQTTLHVLIVQRYQSSDALFGFQGRGI